MYMFLLSDNAWICARPTIDRDLVSFIPDKKEREREKEKNKMGKR